MKRIVFEGRAVAGGLLMLALAPLAVSVGLASGGSATLGIAALIGVGMMVAMRFTPLSLALKLFLLVAASALLQKIFGFVKVEEQRGLSVGNLLVVALFGTWVFGGFWKGRLYKPTPIDVSLIFAVVLIPFSSLLYTVAFRDVPGYEFKEVALYWKSWVTPFFYFFILLQCVETKKELTILLYSVLGLCGVSALLTLDEAFRTAAAVEGYRTDSMADANIYAAMICEAAPFVLLTIFLPRRLEFVKLTCLGLMGLLSLAMLTTVSRSGYIGFFFLLAGSMFISRRSGRPVPILIPSLVVMSMVLVILAARPDMGQQIGDRFDLEEESQNVRVSKDTFWVLNKFSGDRLQLWINAVKMWEDNPLFGRGFRAYKYLAPTFHVREIDRGAHSLYFESLAEGGIVYLLALLVLFIKLARLLHAGWKQALRSGEVMGQICCGGGLVSLLLFSWCAATVGIWHPSIQCIVFALLMGIAAKYAILLLEQEQSSQAAGPSVSYVSEEPIPAVEGMGKGYRR